MNKKLIRVVIPVLIVIEFSFIFLTFMSYQNKDINTIKETSKVDKERFAMYVENLEGGYDQVEKISDISARHVLDQEKTMCVDNKGEKVENVLTYADGKVTVTSNKTLFCYLYFDMKIDVQIDVTTDGENGKVPTTLGYKKTITCEDGTSPTWNYKYNRLEFTGIGSGETKCNLTYTKDTNTYETLVNVVEKDDEVQYASYNEPDYTTGVSLTENEYLNVETYYSSNYKSESGTPISDVFTYSNEVWNNIPSNMPTGKYYHMKFNVPDDGYYQICYNLSAGYLANELLAFKNTTQLLEVNSSNSEEKSGCVGLGYIDSEDYVMIANYTSQYNDYAISEVDFSVQKVEYTDYSAGYRYWGTNPDNYVWFNNEMWRIIGSIPTRVSEDGTTESLVKIIRKDSIGGLATKKGLWGEDQVLYKLLNGYYYGKKNGTNSSYCFSNTSNETQKGKCDYSASGIAENSVYGKMINDVYWGNGWISNTQATPRTAFYEYENSSFVKGKIGLISPSDYGFATNNRYFDTRLENYGISDVAVSNWLYNQPSELTINISGVQSTAWMISLARLYQRSVSENSTIRPALYLDSSVYVMSGTGSESDPYLIAMK